MIKPQILDFTNPENWTGAQPFVNALGAFPSSFTSTIRTLIIDGNKSPNTLSPGGRFLMTRFVKIPGMRAPIYFAALTFHKSDLGTDYISPAGLVKPFGAHEIAAVIGLLYVYRRARKLCDPEEWAILVKHLNETVDIGGHIGLAIPNIGPSLGMLVAGLPILAQATFSIKDKKGYKEYRRLLKNKDLLYDPKEELSRWKTSSVHIAANIMQTLGIGIQIAEAFVSAVGAGSSVNFDTNPDAYRLHIANVWLESLRTTGAAPEMVHKGQFYPLKQDLENLVDIVGTIRESGSKFSWLEKTKDSISPSLSPQLFKAGETVQPEPEVDPTHSASTVKIPTYEELPTEVRELFSKEEMEQMSPQEIEDILKQAEEVEELS